MRQKKAAMEMSVGTLVTIVLLMVVLVLGIVLIRSIFGGGQDAVENINNQIIDEINKVFSDETRLISVAPASRTISLERSGKPAGFAFSVRNSKTEAKTFSYITFADSTPKCGASFTSVDADKYLLVNKGSFSLGAGQTLDLPILIKFQIPSGAPPCTIIYRINICEGSTCEKGSTTYASVPQIYVTIK